MKWIILFHFVIAVLLMSCGLFGKKVSVQEFIPGVYVAQWTSEFADSRDTLQIEALAAPSEGMYAITRRSYHVYNQRTKRRKPAYELQHWTASYAQREQVLLVHKNGRVLSFDPAKQEMRMGITIYRKL